MSTGPEAAPATRSDTDYDMMYDLHALSWIIARGATPAMHEQSRGSGGTHRLNEDDVGLYTRVLICRSVRCRVSEQMSTCALK